MDQKFPEDAPETPGNGAEKGQPKQKFMIRHGKVVLRHWHVIALEIVACFVLLIAVAAGLLVWRLVSGPVDMGFARDYIQEALRVPEQGLTPTVGDIVLSWPDLSGPLLLGFKNAKIFNADGKQVFAVDEAALSLSKASLLIGRISPVALIVRAPVIQVIRTKRGRLVFGIVGLEAESPTYGPYMPKEGNPALEKILNYIARPGKAQHGLGTLEAFKIEGAKVIVEDETLGSSWILPRMDASFESEENILNADLDVRFSDDDSGASFLKMNVNVPWDSQKMQVKADLKGFDPWFFAQRIPELQNLQKGDAFFDGQVAAVLDPSLQPHKALIELSSVGGKIYSPTISTTPIEYKDFMLKAAYDDEKGRLELADTKATINGITVHAKAALEATQKKISGPIHLSIDKMAQKSIGPLWPPFLKGDKAQEWIVHKLSEGVFRDLYADVEVLAMKSDEGWIAGVPNVIAGFAFEGMKVEYRPPLMPVTKGKGKGVFNMKEQTLDIDVESGKIKDLDVAGKLAFTTILQKGMGHADIDVVVKGPLGTGIEYVALEPVHVKTKFDPKQVKGDANLKVHLFLPTRKGVKFSEVKIGIQGTLDKVFLPSVVKDLSLIGGPLNLKVEGNDLSVEGKGELGGRPVSFKYNEFLRTEGQKHRFTVQANLNSDGTLREKLGINLDDYLDGSTPVEMTYTEYAGERSVADIKGDLTDARVFITPFEYEKKPGVKGTVTLKAELQNGFPKEIKDLEIETEGLSFKNTNISFRRKDEKTSLSKGTIGSFMIGETRGSANFTVDEATGRYNIKADCSLFDLAPFAHRKERTKEVYDDPPMLIDMSAAEMLGADDKKMPAGKFLIEIDGEGLYDRLEVDTAAGSGPISIRLGDENGVRTFKLSAADAGAMLNAFGVYKNIRGGTMSINGKAKAPGERNMAGKGEIKDFRVVKAPTLARLISALSLPGIASLLGGEGLEFSKLEADYRWNSKPGGSVLEIKDGRTSGNSVGFSFDGKVDLADSTLDISGTVVPLSDINKIIGSIPLVGDILTGGSGLIAATYSVRGKTEEPAVMVNPLSVLTPGILRKILFE